MKLHELNPDDEFTFLHLDLKGDFGSKFPPSVIGKRFRLVELTTTRAYITGLDPEVERFQREMCFRDYEVRLMALLESTPQSSFTIPANLGDIEFLRDHPDILKKMVERSKSGNLDPFIIDRSADDRAKGMSWKYTPEGMDFWNEVLMSRDPKHFYTLYPKADTHSTESKAESTMSSKPSYTNGTEQKVPRPAPAIRTGKRIGGSAVSGKRSRSATVRGYLSHRTVSGS